jgi:hypothetical protein
MHCDATYPVLLANIGFGGISYDVIFQQRHLLSVTPGFVHGAINQCITRVFSKKGAT